MPPRIDDNLTATYTWATNLDIAATVNPNNVLTTNTLDYETWKNRYAPIDCSGIANISLKDVYIRRDEVYDILNKLLNNFARMLKDLKHIDIDESDIMEILKETL